jgi:deoxyribonuclease-4
MEAKLHPTLTREESKALLHIGGHVKLDESSISQADTFQCFLHNNRAHFTPIMVDKWIESGIKFNPEEGGKRVAHASYVTYPWSIEETTWHRSIQDVKIISQCANVLGIHFENVHFPRNLHLDQYFAKRFPECMSVLEPPCILVLENIGIKPNVEAGLGPPVEWIKQAASMMRKLWPMGKDGKQWGICLDTAHLFATGQPITTEAEMNALTGALDEADVPVKLFHLNGSKSIFNSGIARHADTGSIFDNIWGKDRSGLKRLLEWAMKKRVPLILERPSFNKPPQYASEIARLKKLVGASE